ncbi:[acyl-carrier-protein] S-malonyltransferase [Streptomyces sp. WAC05292]|uniref:ACP S-malonyltransferase n=1 Tax=Streptomyces sp. WAC05292 TaxID=2487418 RepID=UPI0002644554|nr:ACP S-malonyltransferase [Streptomyces sp. WAC05292]AFK80343.1 putative acytransferase [Streptomyces sp. WAC05292]RSS97612.1 [acyl-carrier-protein] S-malonyltransferase [Streptomyces sp. WAC05292]
MLTPVFLFAGQGSQYHGMGKWLYGADAVFRDTLDSLDATVREVRGDSVVEAIHGPGRGPEHPMTRFSVTQPAIFMVEYALARMLQAHGFAPGAVLGASLGEVAAAAVAGAVDPEACLRSLLRQVDVFEAECPRGGMLAVLADRQLADRDPALAGAHVAAVNSPENFVLAGTAEVLDRIERHLHTTGTLCQRLPVLFPFHSPLIDPVEGVFKDLVGDLAMKPAAVPLISGTTGAPVRMPDPAHLWRVLREPFDLTRALGPLLERDDLLFLDLGPSGSMANLVRAALPEGSGSRVLPLMSPYARDEVLYRAVLDARPGLAAVPARIEVNPVSAPAAPPAHRTAAAPTLHVHVFPGQGAQAKGMGREVFDRFPDLVARADAVLGYSLRELCLEDPGRNLRDTRYTQPALYAVNSLTWLAAVGEGGRLPDYVLGHSLGEFSALFAAGVYDFETGLRLVAERGRLMGQVTGGTMAAVSYVDAALVERVLREEGLGDIDIANHNAPTQTVIAGPAESVGRALPALKAAGARCAPLNVSAPFHSRYMAGAAEEFGRLLDATPFAAPKIPVIANVDARPYEAGEVAATLRRQIASPVRWTDSIRFLMGQGDFTVRELGPGQVLTKLVARIREEATPPAASPRTPGPALAEPVRTPPVRTGPAASPPAAPAASVRPAAATAGTLGSEDFRRDYGVRLAYAAGGMRRGISSVGLVARMARAGLLSYFGASGLPPRDVAAAVAEIRARVPAGAPFGVNVTHDPFDPRAESELVDVLIRDDVRFVEASTHVEATPALVRHRLTGARMRADGTVHVPRKILAKVTRPDAARLFLEPPPAPLVRRLAAEGLLTAEEAEAGARVALADDVCAVGDAGDHSDMATLWALLPALRGLRAELGGTADAVRIGAGGGIGAPESAAAAFVLGADFVLTGSVNACTAESGTSAAAKDLLQEADVHDTAFAPYGDLFELGGRARVLRKGVLFHARAGKLHDLWRNHDAWESVPASVRAKVERDYLGASFEEVLARAGGDADSALDPKRRMALVFRWYCAQAATWAIEGTPGREADYQIPCGPALGACNRWLAPTPLRAWPARHADELAERLMDEAAEIAGGGLRGRST